MRYVPWMVDTLVPVLRIRKGRPWEVKGGPKSYRWSMGKPRSQKHISYFTLSSVLSPSIPLVFKRLEWLTSNHSHITHCLIAKGFQGRNIYVRDYIYVQIFSSLFILVRIKTNFFCSHCYCLYFQQISCSVCCWSDAAWCKNTNRKSEMFIPLKKTPRKVRRGNFFLFLHFPTLC